MASTPKSAWAKLVKQYLQFSLIGVGNAVLDLGSLNLFLILWPTSNPWRLLFYNTIAVGLAVLNSYIWNSRWTFKKAADENAREKLLFTIQALISLAVNNLIFVVVAGWLLQTQLPTWVSHNAAKGLAMFLGALTSFLLMKFWVFRDAENEQPQES